MRVNAKTARRVAQFENSALARVERKCRQKAAGNRADGYRFLAATLAEVEEQPWDSHDLKIRAIGQRAFDQSGRRAMLAAYWKLQKQGVLVGGRWDGIGGWYA